MKDQLTPIKRTRAALLPSATAALLANLLLAPASYGTLTINAVEDNENGVVVFEAEAGIKGGGVPHRLATERLVLRLVSDA